METKTNLKQLKRIYLFLLIGQLLFAAVTIFLNWGEDLATDFSMDNVFLLILPIMLLSVTLIRNWFKTKASLEAKKMAGSLEEKMMHYQRTMLVCCSLLEGVNLFAIVSFLLSPNIYCLLFFAIGLLLYLQVRPSADDFAQVYTVSSSERSMLMREEA